MSFKNSTNCSLYMLPFLKILYENITFSIIFQNFHLPSKQLSSKCREQILTSFVLYLSARLIHRIKAPRHSASFRSLGRLNHLMTLLCLPPPQAKLFQAYRNTVAWFKSSAKPKKQK